MIKCKNGLLGKQYLFKVLHSLELLTSMKAVEKYQHILI